MQENYDDFIPPQKKSYISHSPSDESLVIGKLSINFGACDVQVGEISYSLTPLELKFLRCLSACQGCVVSHDDLLSQVWGCCPETGGTPNQVSNCAKRLQRKLNSIKTDPPYLLCVRGHGYRLVTDAEWHRACGA